MKLAFILPAIGKKKNRKYMKSWTMEPIMIAVLKRLTPDDIETVFYDDRIEAIDYDTDADIIALSVETHTAKRAYTIAERFKAKGKRIVMGGYHVTTVPEDARSHADILVLGNAESVWEDMLRDVETGNYKNEYAGDVCCDYGQPDRSIYADKRKKYLPLGLVEIGRGCHYNCEFCSVSSYYKRAYAHRSIAAIVQEIKENPHKVYFFVDDSIFSDKEFAKALFIEVTKLHIHWVTQITLDIARDEELLSLMAASGCKVILIGFESIDPQNLKQMNKEWSIKVGERDALVERIHNAGISIYASFVFGFDYDNEESFKNCLEFSRRHQFFVAAYNHLLPFPGTATHERLCREGRMIYENWWLSREYTYGSIPYHSKLVTAEELGLLCKKYKKAFFCFSSIFTRYKTLKKRTNVTYVRFAYWVTNLMLHWEVNKRFGIPLGENLDEKKR
ncbi:MAG: radical SAM protein [Clostridiales Family XIII bacterium]|jgi:radical SAM superfamily enzyme YgiQ (UPF0313 family)|nr:radical SAM protein [Clostridiales Family XIII bacterium]